MQWHHWTVEQWRHDLWSDELHFSHRVRSWVLHRWPFILTALLESLVNRNLTLAPECVTCRQFEILVLKTWIFHSSSCFKSLLLFRKVWTAAPRFHKWGISNSVAKLLISSCHECRERKRNKKYEMSLDVKDQLVLHIVQISGGNFYPAGLPSSLTCIRGFADTSTNKPEDRWII